MNEEPITEVGHWIGKAKSDRLNVENNLVAAEVPWDTVCYHCAQAAEKLLKAVLVKHGQEVRRTHNLLELAELCHDALGHSAWVALQGPLRVLNPHGVIPRYEMPPPGTELAGREAYDALRAAWDVVLPLLEGQEATPAD